MPCNMEGKNHAEQGPTPGEKVKGKVHYPDTHSAFSDFSGIAADKCLGTKRQRRMHMVVLSETAASSIQRILIHSTLTMDG